jgi:hypothetical protein
MKKILALFLVLFLSMVLTSCVGLGYGDLPKRYTSWSSDDEKLKFQFQGYHDNYGMGRIIINQEEVEVALILDQVSQVLSIFRYEDFLEEDMYMDFEIATYRSGLNVEKDRIKLTIRENNSNDKSYDTSFDIYRVDLDESDIDAKYYAGTSWENSLYGFQLNCSKKSDFTKVMDGFVKYQTIDLEIEFHFKDNQQFEVYSSDMFVLSGTYETDDFEMILYFTQNELYTGLSSLILTVIENM